MMNNRFARNGQRSSSPTFPSIPMFHHPEINNELSLGDLMHLASDDILFLLPHERLGRIRRRVSNRLSRRYPPTFGNMYYSNSSDDRHRHRRRHPEEILCYSPIRRHLIPRVRIFYHPEWRRRMEWLGQVLQSSVPQIAPEPRRMAEFNAFLAECEGLPIEVIESLPVFKDENNSSCAICLDVSRDKMFKKLPTCGHVFHKLCLDKWLLIKSNCPICRREVQL